MQLSCSWNGLEHIVSSTIASNEAQKTGKNFLGYLLTLLPCIVGLALSRTAVRGFTYIGDGQNDFMFFTDTVKVLKNVVFLVLMVVLVFFGAHWSKRAINKLFVASNAAAITCELLMSVLDAAGFSSLVASLLFATVGIVASWLCLFYWLRRCRGAGARTTLIVIMAAMMIGEVVSGSLRVIPMKLQYIGFIMIAVLQYPCLIWAQRSPNPYEVAPDATAEYCFEFCGSRLKDNAILITSFLGFLLYSFASGFMTGYEDTLDIAYSLPAYSLHMCLTIVLGVFLTYVAFKKTPIVALLSLWFTLQGLAILAFISFFILPGSELMGKMFDDTQSMISMSFICYLIIAFMSNGKRPTFFYAFVLFGTLMMPRPVIRILLVGGILAPIDYFAASALVLIFIILGFQLITAQLLNTMQTTSASLEDEAALGVVRSERTAMKPLTRFMGLDAEMSSSEARQTIMMHSAQEVGNQYLLTEREVEVLGLYALGYTQSHVAEVLCLSEGTVHSHIKSIYAKTGLHSRQAILDYMNAYTS